jgi:hypothetical protein
MSSYIPISHVTYMYALIGITHMLNGPILTLELQNIKEKAQTLLYDSLRPTMGLVDLSGLRSGRIRSLCSKYLTLLYISMWHLDTSFCGCSFLV